MVSYGWYVFESGASHPTEDEAAAVRFAVNNFPVFTVSWTNLLAPANGSTREDIGWVEYAARRRCPAHSNTQSRWPDTTGSLLNSSPLFF